MYQFGPHVILAGIRPELAAAFPIVGDVYTHHGQTAIITCVKDRNHGFGSLHYTGAAFDVWWSDDWDLDPELIRLKLYRYLNGFPAHKQIPAEWDIVFEGDHFHIEFQPKVSHETYSRLVRDYLSSL